MASAISPSSRKRKADEWEWESFPEEDPTVDENIALAKYYGTCSSTSSLSSASSSASSSTSSIATSSAPSIPITKKPVAPSRKKPNVIVRDKRHIFYGSNSNVPRVDSSIITLIPSKSTSWVWDHFHKFSLLTHPDKKGVVSCNICYLAAEKDKNIKFTVDYKVYIASHSDFSN